MIFNLVDLVLEVEGGVHVGAKVVVGHMWQPGEEPQTQRSESNRSLRQSSEFLEVEHEQTEDTSGL